MHNLQGDIVGILDNKGIFVAEYKYDAWGCLLTTSSTLTDTLGKLNPFRYRGYVYDEESMLYYARSRYYASNYGRFLNADNVDILLNTVGQFYGSNQYQYCKNACPISADEDGKWLNIVIGAAAGAIISAGCQLVSNCVQGKDLTDGLLTSAISGAITGGLAVSGVAQIGQAVVGALVGAGAEFSQQMYDSGGDVNLPDLIVDCTVAAGFGALGGYYGGDGLLHYTGSVYKKGVSLINVMNNIDNGVYTSTSKAMSRLTSVGTQYTKEYTKQALSVTTKYTVAAVATTVFKSHAQQIANAGVRWIGGSPYRLYSMATAV